MTARLQPLMRDQTKIRGRNDDCLKKAGRFTIFCQSVMPEMEF